jgi:hypothetical protein
MNIDTEVLVILVLCGFASMFLILGAIAGYLTLGKFRSFFAFGMVRGLLGYADDESDTDKAATKILAQAAAKPIGHRDPKEVIQTLDFDAAVAKHRQMQQDPARQQQEVAQVPPQNSTSTQQQVKIEAQDFNVDAASPIQRYRRVSGAEEVYNPNQDFRPEEIIHDEPKPGVNPPPSQ